MRRLYLVPLAACALFLTGARPVGGDEALGTMEGTVTYKGTPLMSGTITFHHKDDQFTGAKIKDGKYRVDRVPAEEVTVSINSRLPLPEKYLHQETSPLTTKVKKGKNTANFDLTD